MILLHACSFPICLNYNEQSLATASQKTKSTLQNRFNFSPPQLRCGVINVAECHLALSTRINEQSQKHVKYRNFFPKIIMTTPNALLS